MHCFLNHDSPPPPTLFLTMYITHETTRAPLTMVCPPNGRVADLWSTNAAICKWTTLRHCRSHSVRRATHSHRRFWRAHSPAGRPRWRAALEPTTRRWSSNRHSTRTSPRWPYRGDPATPRSYSAEGLKSGISDFLIDVVIESESSWWHIRYVNRKIQLRKRSNCSWLLNVCCLNRFLIILLTTSTF